MKKIKIKEAYTIIAESYNESIEVFNEIHHNQNIKVKKVIIHNKLSTPYKFVEERVLSNINFEDIDFESNNLMFVITEFFL